MRDLLAHAATLGVNVHTAHLPHPYRGFYDPEKKIVVYAIDLTPIERRCVLAHELGHAYYDHQCRGDQRSEDAADYYAARLLIHPEEYVAAERLDPSPEAIAEELSVEPRLVRIFEKRALTRVRGVTYVHSRMGARQHQLAF